MPAAKKDSCILFSIQSFGRRFGGGFEALYVGKAGDIRGRARGQLKKSAPDAAFAKRKKRQADYFCWPLHT